MAQTNHLYKIAILSVSKIEAGLERLIAQHMYHKSCCHVNIVVVQNSRIRCHIRCFVQVKYHALCNECIYFQLSSLHCQQLHTTTDATALSTCYAVNNSINNLGSFLLCESLISGSYREGFVNANANSPTIH